MLLLPEERTMNVRRQTQPASASHTLSATSAACISPITIVQPLSHPPSLYLRDALNSWFLLPPNVHAFMPFVYLLLWASFHFCLLHGCFSFNVSHCSSLKVCLFGFVNIWYSVRIKLCGHVRPPHSHRPAYRLFPAGQTPFPRTIDQDNKALYCVINQGDDAEATLFGFAQRARPSEL